MEKAPVSKQMGQLVRWLLVPLALGALIAGVALLSVNGGASDARSAQVCERVASPHGSDRADGTAKRPFRTAQRLVSSLRAGWTGCLKRGNYRGYLQIRNRGTGAKPIVLRPYPHESARIVGRIVADGRSAHVKVWGLYLDGRNRRRLPSPTVNGRHISFVSNDVTNRRTAICFVLGHPRFGVARAVNVQRNRIHGCGRLPATNQHHGLYVSLARDTRIVGNWIIKNADRGIQLYPDARRSYIAGNVIDSNGQGATFGGGGGVASSDNLIQGNVISNSRLRYNIESYFESGGSIGSGNVVQGNCIGGGARKAEAGGILSPSVGFQTIGNVVATPSFKSERRGDYRLAPEDPCVAILAGNLNRVPGPPTGPPRPPR